MRYADDPGRDEARNLAVVLVDAEGQFGGVRSAPPSSLSANLRKQGILDALLQGLKSQFDAPTKPDLAWLHTLGRGLTQSVYLTEPKSVAVGDPDTVIRSLYRALVAPRPAPRSETKAFVLDKVVRVVRDWGFNARRSEYYNDFIFDVIVEAPNNTVLLDVLSFATAARDLTGVERDAGHFLYATRELHAPAVVVLRPPSDEGTSTAVRSFERVQRWCTNADIPLVRLAEIDVLRRLLA